MASVKQKTTSPRQKSKEPVDLENKVPAMHVGQVLRQSREERKVSLDVVADELMIRRFYLEALENGSFRDLPERVYAIGFVRNYATYLGLQPSVMIEQFKREAYGARNMNNYQVDLTMPEPVMHSVVPNRSAIISAVVALVILAVGVVFATRDGKPVADTVPEPAVAENIALDAAAVPAPGDVVNNDVATPSATTGDAPDVADADDSAAQMPQVTFTTDTKPADAPVPAVTEEAPAEPAPAVAETAAPVEPIAVSAEAVPPAVMKLKERRVLEAMQSAWVEVKNDRGNVLFTSILKKGQILPLPNDTKIMLTTGNAGGLRLIVDGKPETVFGQLNEVKRNIVLDPQRLGQR